MNKLKTYIEIYYISEYQQNLYFILKLATFAKTLSENNTNRNPVWLPKH